jgi:hypothetical protein
VVIKLEAEVKNLAGNLEKRLAAAVKATRTSAYVGVPSKTNRKLSTKVERAVEAVKSGTATAKQRKLAKRSKTPINNAELLFIHTKGSPKRKIPARPVIEPAVKAEGNRQIIGRELAEMANAALDGKGPEAAQRAARRAAMAGQNAAREWFTDQRNGWAPNKPRTIKRKGSDRPLIDTGSLRAAIVGVVVEEE